MTKAELDKGELLTADNAIDTTTGTIKLKATFRTGMRGCGRASSLTPGC